jgi:MSHA biogenesis protein MshI
MAMRLGLRAYLRQKFGKPSPYLSIGIAIGEDAAFFNVLYKHSSGRIELKAEKVVSINNWPKSLKTWVEDEHLKLTHTYVAFSISHYQQYQMDKPAVEKDEVVNALKWSVNELIGSEDARAIDYFDLPVAVAGSAKVNVVALSNNAIESVVEAVLDAGLILKNISVEEMVTCNLLCGESEAVLSLIQDEGDEVCLNIVKDDSLYFSRRLKGFENLNSFSIDELNMGIIDSLCVQIQRSMDYFESQLRQAPIRHIQFKLDTQHLAAVKALIEQAIPAQVKVMDVNVQVAENINPYRLSYSALGAALQANYHEAMV